MTFETGGNYRMAKRGETVRLDLPEDIFLPEDVEIDGELIRKLVNTGESRKFRYKLLQDYYNGYAVIQDRVKEEHKPNNKIVSGYPSYIVDVIQGYFIGKPVEYTASENEKEFLAKVKEVLAFNDEQDENSELAKIAGIKGRAYELVYQDSKGRTRFNQLEPDNIVYVYDTKVNPEPLLAVRYYRERREGPITAHVYTREDELIFKEGSNGFMLKETYPHQFGQCPVIEFKNNDEGIGDFERVISYIDAYNKVNSDNANDFEEFTDAFLYLHNMLGTTPEQATKLKEDRIILGGEGQDAKWLIKDLNSTAIEDFKNRLDNDIHKFSKVPNMSDEQFAGNVSGESMKYKLLALDQLIVTKQRKFKKGLQKRLELISKVINVRYGIDYTDIKIQFQTNRPINEKEVVEMANNLRGLTSDITALGKVAQVTGISATEEKERLEEEVDPYLNNFSLGGEEDDEEGKEDLEADKEEL